MANQDQKLGHVINALYSIAYGLDALRKLLCGEMSSGLSFNLPSLHEFSIHKHMYAGMCPQLRNVTGYKLRDAILNETFISYSGDGIHFDGNGDGPGRYDVMNFQAVRETDSAESTYMYRKLGLSTFA